jgi:hypothetical protein
LCNAVPRQQSSASMPRNKNRRIGIYAAFRGLISP